MKTSIVAIITTTICLILFSDFLLHSLFQLPFSSVPLSYSSAHSPATYDNGSGYVFSSSSFSSSSFFLAFLIPMI
ncbi:MAG TPA: hypothetical protein VKA95_03615 [Nitrososphaeraceae archaeon]|nr:hypothetical protein [Nitrososphaeraceae archaeon]